MTKAIFWDSNKVAEFQSLQDLEVLLDQLTSMAAVRAMPLGVQIELDTETSLLIMLGREVSHIAYYSTSARPLAVVCRGPWTSDELIELSFMGEPSTVTRRNYVPVADAREAVRRYYLTGTRPDNIAWDR